MKTKIFLITGFLGAGKTTFLQGILRNIQEPVGVLVNEFGQVNIDGETIREDSLDMVLLSNGSIFCSCLKEDFINGLNVLINNHHKYIFVESSGLADPSNMGSIMSLLKTNNSNDFEYAGSICLIDALYFEKTLEVMVSVERQIKYSSIIIINKTDLSSNDKLEVIKEKIKQINNEAFLYKTTYGNVDINVLDSIKDYNKYQETTNKKDNRPKTITMHVSDDIELDLINNIVDELKQYCFRIKGYIKKETTLYKIDAVNEEIDIIPYEKNVITENYLVFISSIGLPILKKIYSVANQYIEGKYEIEM